MFRSSWDHPQGVYIKQTNIIHMFVWGKLPEDDLKKIKTCWSFSGLYVKVYVLIRVFVHLLVGHTLPPGKTRYPLHRRLAGPQGRSGQVRKISPPPGFDPRTVQPIGSRYTDWAAICWYYPLNCSYAWLWILQRKLTGVQPVRVTKEIYSM
jgi:hypothetical protein